MKIKGNLLIFSSDNEDRTDVRKLKEKRLVITFLPRSKHLLISWLQSPSAVILEPQKNKV